MKVLNYSLAVISILIESIRKYKFSKWMFVIVIISLLGMCGHGECITDSGEIYQGNSIPLGIWWSLFITGFIAIFLKGSIKK